MFFFVPLVLWALGIQSATSDKRALAPFPRSFMSWDVMDETAEYVNDHVPFRGLAVRWRAETTQALFGEAPAGQGGNLGEAAAREPQTEKEREFLQLPPAAPEPAVAGTSDVIVGTEGWLFATSEFANECSPQQPRKTVVRNLRRLERILARSGRTLVIALAPDKSTAEPEHLPDSNPYATCSAQAKEETWSLLTNAAIPGVIDTKGLVATREEREQREYWLRKDTHWNGLARAAVAREIARVLDPGLLEQTKVTETVAEYTGDLTELLGAPSTDQTLEASIERIGVSVEVAREAITTGVRATITRATSTSAPVFEDGVILVGDSFAQSIIPHLAPFMQQMTWIHTGDVRAAPATTAERIATASAVVVVWSERYFASTTYGTLWSTPFLDQLAATLPALQP